MEGTYCICFQKDMTHQRKWGTEDIAISPQESLQAGLVVKWAA